MIDVHVHVDLRNPVFLQRLDADVAADPRKMAEALRKEMHQAGITTALAMPRSSATDEDPLGIQATLAVAQHLPGLHAIGVADPSRTDASHFRHVEDALRAKSVVAFKAYAGYTCAGPEHPGFFPYYELAATYNLPVFVHTGDTPVRGAKVRFAHPLLVDDVAVDFPRVKFILAHFGNPWFTDAAEVVYKNDNVWADLSGWFFGGDDFFSDPSRARMLDRFVAKVADAMEYTEKPDRILFGTDWPLVPMQAYHELACRIVPEQHWPRVFAENALELFPLRLATA